MTAALLFAVVFTSAVVATAATAWLCHWIDRQDCGFANLTDDEEAS